MPTGNRLISSCRWLTKMKRAHGVGGLIPPGRRRMTSCHGKRPRHFQNSFIGPKPAQSLSFLHRGGLNGRRHPSRAASFFSFRPTHGCPSRFSAKATKLELCPEGGRELSPKVEWR